MHKICLDHCTHDPTINRTLLQLTDGYKSNIIVSSHDTHTCAMLVQLTKILELLVKRKLYHWHIGEINNHAISALIGTAIVLFVTSSKHVCGSAATSSSSLERDQNRERVGKKTNNCNSFILYQ